MANYIATLRADIVSRESRISAAAELVQEYRAFLASPKFSGIDTDGARKDWIATGDVCRMLSGLTDSLSGL